MRISIWIILIIGLFGCNGQETKKETPNNNTLLAISIDSFVVYYTDSMLYHNIDENTNDSIRFLNSFLHHENMNFYNSNFFSVVLTDSIMIKDSILIKKLKTIFYNRNKNEELQQVSDCLPDYRDLIIFYSKGKRVGGIKICFTCGYIKFSPTDLNSNFEVTENAFDELENYFKKNIHKIHR